MTFWSFLTSIAPIRERFTWDLKFDILKKQIRLWGKKVKKVPCIVGAI